MRRLPLALAVSAVIPALSFIAISPASAAGSSLTVTTLGRNGSKVATTVSVEEIHGISTYSVASGKKLTLPAGKYAVLVDVWNSKDDTDTVGGKVVTVSGATSATIDARQGQPLKVTVDPDPGADYVQTLFANICTADAISEAAAYNSPGRVFVIPNSDKTLSFAYMSILRPADEDPKLPTFDLVGRASGSPATPGGAWHRSALATVDVQVRKGPSVGSSADLSLTPDPKTGSVDCASGFFQEIHSSPSAFSTTALVSPGRWDIRSDAFGDHQGENWDVGAWFDPQTLSTGQVYSHVFNHSAWGPSHNLPMVKSKTLTFDIGNMFGDPYFANSGSDGSVNATATLSLSGTKVATESLSTYGDGSVSYFHKKLSKAGWYTLAVSATHVQPSITLPSDMLSPTAGLSFHFYADPAAGSVVAPVFLTRFLPLSLNSSNKAAPNSTTTVQLKLDRTAQDPDVTLHSDTVKTISASASYDGGKTWHSVKVTHSGSAWTAAVTNPASGTVSLRDTVTDAKGNSSTVTVDKAYAIS